jgi:pyruvate,water dikinase
MPNGEGPVQVIALSDVTADMVDLVGGKAAGLGAMLRLGLRVPDGFCVTTEAHRGGEIPRAKILEAYERLGGGPVAVRSSATAEDSPDASFAGQLDTVLGVRGADALMAAIAQCWDSAHGERVVAYRAGHAESNTAGRAGGDGTAPDQALAIAVVVQRMVDAEVAGVLFTANPLTGCRTEMLVDAAQGLGTAVVDGTAEVDHYVLREGAPTPGTPTALPGRGDSGRTARPQSPHPVALDELRVLGARLQEHFGSPQDVEWAIDRQGELWLLQSRPITTLFPLPPPADDPLPRVYLEFGHVQGMLQPVTPMGMSGLRALVAAMLAPLGLRVEITDIGGRLYGDMSDLARDAAARKRLVKLLAVDFGPRAQAAMERVLADPRFAPQPGRQKSATPSLRTAARAVGGILRALARPDAARIRMADAIERLRLAAAAPAGLSTAAERMHFVRALDSAEPADEIIWPIVTGMLASALPVRLLEGVAGQDEIHAVLGGMPHNVTIEMDLALWRVAQAAGEHRPLLLDTPPAELAVRYRHGKLPEIGLAGFLDSYGHRGAAEVDLGVPRWDEDPAPVFAALANYLRVTDPEQGPDRRFARAAVDAEAALRDLAGRVRRRRPVRGRLAVFLLGRARSLAGLREAGKFAGLYRLREMRRQLLLIGDELAGTALLAEGPDVMFLTMDEADDAVRRRADHRATVAARKAVHRRELRRKAVPVALLSDGTDIEALAPPTADLVGVGASAGRATGPARVVDDPATAHLEPGEILIAATTDPGWTPLFLTAAALVTETGAIMAHGPTVAREYGIPAVISVPAATRKITTGQIITVDGRSGTVTFA